MTEGRNIAIVHGLIEKVLNAHNPPALGEYVSNDFAAHFAGFGTVQGLDNYTDLVTNFFVSLPDARWTELDAVSQGDKVYVRFAIRATHAGDLWGIAATGRLLTWEAAMLYRIADDRIVELHAVEDWATMLREMGFFTLPF